jgi:hypothetical protein
VAALSKENFFAIEKNNDENMKFMLLNGNCEVIEEFDFDIKFEVAFGNKKNIFYSHRNHFETIALWSSETNRLFKYENKIWQAMNFESKSLKWANDEIFAIHKPGSNENFIKVELLINYSLKFL